MIVARLKNLFGENELFNEDVAGEMKRNMIKDLEEEMGRQIERDRIVGRRRPRDWQQ